MVAYLSWKLAERDFRWVKLAEKLTESTWRSHQWIEFDERQILREPRLNNSFDGQAQTSPELEKPGYCPARRVSEPPETADFGP